MRHSGPIKRLEYQRRYRAKNRERLNEMNRGYRKKHLELYKQRDAARRKRERGKRIEYHRKRRKQNRAKMNQLRNDWHKAHPGSRAAHHKVAKALAYGRLVKPKNCSRCGKE